MKSINEISREKVLWEMHEMKELLQMAESAYIAGIPRTMGLRLETLAFKARVLADLCPP